MLSRGRDSQGEEVMRSYTPITLDSDIGYFELVVKVQFFSFFWTNFEKMINEFIFTILILSNFICKNDHVHQLYAQADVPKWKNVPPF
jgi:hypothetical protein